MVENKDKKVIRLADIKEKGLCEGYYDVLSTNCVNVEWCPAGTDYSYPKFAVRKGPEFGFYNLFVFYEHLNN